jgi:hypothetical protein
MTKRISNLPKRSTVIANWLIAMHEAGEVSDVFFTFEQLVSKNF